MSTLKDVAKRAGVSESTASRSLRNLACISDATKKRVQKAADDLEFVFNANARALSTNKRSTIGIVYPDFESQIHRSMYLDMLVHDVRHQLEKRNYDCIVFQAKNCSGESNIKRLVKESKVDGFIFIISDVELSEWEFILKHNIPTVQVHNKPLYWRESDISNEFDYFYSDNFKGGELAAQHLASLKKKNCVILADEFNGSEMVSRTEGFISKMQSSSAEGCQVSVIKLESSFESVYSYVNEHISFIKSFDSIFAHTDMMAIGAMRALNENYVTIPKEISIIGYDDIPFSSLISPPLTTIHQPRETEALLACERLVELISKKHIKNKIHKIVEPTLVIRSST